MSTLGSVEIPPTTDDTATRLSDVLHATSVYDLTSDDAGRVCVRWRASATVSGTASARTERPVVYKVGNASVNLQG